jgi:hypothetical protein
LFGWFSPFEIPIERMPPPLQVQLLISTLETGGDISRFGKGIESCYKTPDDFNQTRDHEAFRNDKLIQLIQENIKTAPESALPSFLIILRRLTWIGSVGIKE